MNQIFSPEVQRNVLDLYRMGIPVAEIVHRTGVSRSRVYALINSSNLPHQRKKRNQTEKTDCTDQNLPFTNLEVRKQLIVEFQACSNKSQFAQDHQIPRSTLYRWNHESASLIQSYNGKTMFLCEIPQ